MKDFNSEISHPRGRKATAGRRRLLPSAFCLLLSAFSVTTEARGAWSRQQSGTFAWLHAVFFVDERRGWAAGSKGALLSTEDGGATWKLKSPAPTEDALRDIFFVDALHGWAVCDRDWFRLKTKEESRSYLLKTADSGRTWARVEVTGGDTDARLVGVRFAGLDHGWAFGEMGALYTTSDGGATWTTQRIPTRRMLLAGTFPDARRGWLVGAGPTVLHTSDGGATWLEARLSASLADYGLRGRANGHEEDATPSAQPASRPASTRAAVARRAVRVNAVSFVDERRGWAVGTGGLVLATGDGGRSWRAQESGVESDLYDVKFLDAREGWAVGGEGAVLHTSDGGATWLAETPVTPHTLERLFFAGRTRGWAVGFGGTIITFGNDQRSSQ